VYNNDNNNKVVAWAIQIYLSFWWS